MHGRQKDTTAHHDRFGHGAERATELEPAEAVHRVAHGLAVSEFPSSIAPPPVTRSPVAPLGTSVRRIVDAPVGGARPAAGNRLRAISRARPELPKVL